MRVLGLDVGDRYIGVALSDALGLTAQPLNVIDRQAGGAEALVAALVAEHQAERVIVGLPLTLRGEQGPQAAKVTAFADRLRRRTAVPVQLLDERLTTAQGQRVLRETGAKRRGRILDRIAAQLILQHYLDTQHAQRHTGEA